MFLPLPSAITINSFLFCRIIYKSHIVVLLCTTWLSARLSQSSLYQTVLSFSCANYLEAVAFLPTYLPNFLYKSLVH